MTPASGSVHSRLSHDLRAAVADLNEINPRLGLIRFASLGFITIGLGVLTWQADSIGWFMLGAIATSIPYTFWLIGNHDAAHRSLTGWHWFDALTPRLIAWPMLIPAGTYSQVHQLHHGQNATDLRDPERVQWTDTEYKAAPAWQRWYVRHQWPIDIFVLGSLGLIIKTFLDGYKLKASSAYLPQQMATDAIGILGVQITILSLLSLQSFSLWKYLLFLIMIERGVGVIMQTRAHIEHYGLWQQVGSYQITQLYACRNLKTPAYVNWIMSGLPYHAVHHAFPQIPSYRLPEAFRRIQAVLQRHHMPPMTTASGYIASSLRLGLTYSLIKAGSTE